MALNQGIYEYTGAEEVDNTVPAKRWSVLLNLLGSSVRTEVAAIRGTLAGVVNTTDVALAAAVSTLTSATRIAINTAINAQIIGSTGIDNAIATLIGNASSAARAALNVAIDARFSVATGIDAAIAGLIAAGGSATRAAIFTLTRSGPMFLVNRGAAQALAAGVWTLVAQAYGTPAVNSGFTSFTAGVLTISQTGYYRISSHVKFPAPSTAIGHQVLVNSTTVDSAATVSAGYVPSGIVSAATDVVYLTAGDALRLYAYTAGAQNLATNARDLALAVEYVRP